MHIPDGYLGPQTYVPLLAAMAGFWAYALRAVKQTLRLRQVPLLALGAAFCFVIMMFNIPIPGGTTGHATGSVLVAILLGPWAACIAVSLALVVQALVFGDGGLTAIGANCFTMAVVMPLVGWGVYRVVAGTRPANSASHWLGAVLGGYFGLCAAAVTTALFFGIQPLLAVDAAGRALYCPFGLGIAVPAMALEHFLLFGFVEAAATAGVVIYLQRTAPELLPATATTCAADTPASCPCRWFPRLCVGLGLLILLSPLGLYLPERFAAGAAWGEWNGEEIKAEMAKAQGAAGYVPVGIEKAETHGWRAPLPDYALPGDGPLSFRTAATVYMVCGLLGTGLLALLVLPLRRLARTGHFQP